ncbi:MAG: tetratricopeptide repeat protein, partial [Candidatus Competibacteraceae bacterium]|nr:tetratricopeptide repeat protein [Candidatus Competibacteraceae bacterium]
MRTLLKILALAITLALRPAVAGQYETFDYHIQQMIIHALAGDRSSVQTFRELLDNLRQPKAGDPQQARSLSQQGQENLARNNLKSALSAFRQAFIADPADPDIAGWLALTYLRLNRLQEAERLAVYALSLAPAQATHWLTLGEVYGHQGDAQRAAGAMINAYQFAQDQPRMAAQLRQLATTHEADKVRIGALQALQALAATTASSGPLNDDPGAAGHASSLPREPKPAMAPRTQGNS